MKHSVLILLLATSAVAASAQTSAKPTAPTATAPKAVATSAHSAQATTGQKLPPGIPPVKGVTKTAFSLKYQDIKIGTGADAEPNKMYKVLYTGWLAADGHKFDSTDDHPRAPVLDKDGKPVLDADGKPKQGDPQPISFPQGFGRVIPGWDQGFEGMKIGGKRRIFIPWQLAYGARGRQGPDAAHPGIPAKADLIFDVELVGITDLPLPPNHPMGNMPGAHPMGGVQASPQTPVVHLAPSAPAAPAAPQAQPAPAAPAAPQAQTAPVAPSTPVRQTPTAEPQSK
jgi:peptidylprolyl isomerase